MSFIIEYKDGKATIRQETAEEYAQFLRECRERPRQTMNQFVKTITIDDKTIEEIIKKRKESKVR